MMVVESIYDRAARLRFSLAALARRSGVSGRKLYNSIPLTDDELSRIERVLDAAETEPQTTHTRLIESEGPAE